MTEHAPPGGVIPLPFPVNVTEAATHPPPYEWSHGWQPRNPSTAKKYGKKFPPPKGAPTGTGKKSKPKGDGGSGAKGGKKPDVEKLKARVDKYNQDVKKLGEKKRELDERGIKTSSGSPKPIKKRVGGAPAKRKPPKAETPVAPEVQRDLDDAAAAIRGGEHARGVNLLTRAMNNERDPARRRVIKQQRTELAQRLQGGTGAKTEPATPKERSMEDVKADVQAALNAGDMDRVMKLTSEMQEIQRKNVERENAASGRNKSATYDPDVVGARRDVEREQAERPASQKPRIPMQLRSVGSEVVVTTPSGQVKGKVTKVNHERATVTIKTKTGDVEVSSDDVDRVRVERPAARHIGKGNIRSK